jgi:hypothetical protein
MGNEELEAVKKQLAAMKKIELTGFTNTETATAYFQEKEAILEGIVKTLETVTVQERTEVEARKATVKSLRNELKGQAANLRELSRRELLYNLGKGIVAAWAGNHKALADLSFSPNLKAAENWTNPKDVSWGKGAGMFQRKQPSAHRWEEQRQRLLIPSVLKRKITAKSTRMIRPR